MKDTVHNTQPAGIHRWRHELKFAIPQAKAAALTNWLHHRLPADTHGDSGQYVVTSLYCDTDDLRLFQESCDGVKNRFKLRIRTYDDDADAPTFVEVKNRMNRMILKERSSALVPKTDRDCPHEFLRAVLSHANGTSFVNHAQRLAARPRLKVRYRRQAFQSTDGTGLRVTIDSDLCYHASALADAAGDGTGWRRFAHNPNILEIKFNRHFPAWLLQRIRALELRERSFSKYAIAVQQALRETRGTLRRVS